jgi:hypothetical protein
MNARRHQERRDLAPGSEQTYRPASDIAAERLARPVDLAKNLKVLERHRTILGRFLRDVLEEAAYDDEGRPLPGQLHDYYRVPEAPTKALTKLGAEKLAALFRYARGEMKTVSTVETPAYVSARVQMVLVDVYRRVVGSGEGACSTAETSFRSPRARRRYGAVIANDGTVARPADYRAALHDVVARAGKRAFVQAVLYATATDELFTVADCAGGSDALPARMEAAASRARLPKSKFGKYAGQPVTDVPADALAAIAQWCRQEAAKPGVWAPVADAIDAELARRRARPDEVGEALPR